MGWCDIVLVFFGGGMGAACRFAVSCLMNRFAVGAFPAGTVAVNLAGCFLIGLCYAFVGGRLLTPGARLFAMTGFLGGFTTFSTFSLETVNALKNGFAILALTNVAVSVIAGLLLTVLGIRVGNRFF